MLSNSLCTVIAVGLNTSQRRQVGVGINSSVMRLCVEHFEWPMVNNGPCCINI